jgi:glucose uptake protein
MILPQSDVALWLLALLCLFAWGSWPSTYKMGERYRYELYYFDWIVGALILVLVAAVTFGSLGFDGFSFRDDMMIAAKKAWLYAFLSGVIFNLGNLLLLSAVSLAGLAIAFPIGFGVGLTVGAIVTFFVRHSIPVTFLLLGCGFLAAAVVASGLAYRHLVNLRHEELARAGKAKSTRRPPVAKPIILAAISGLFLTSFAPLIEKAREGEVGLGPYSLAFLFVCGVALCGYILNLFMMNLPVEGEPLEILAYFQTPVRNHFLGASGGVLWGIGLVAALIITAPALSVHLNAALPCLFANGSMLLVILSGILIWKELRAADGRVKLLEALSLLLLGGGIIILALAPLFAPSQS